PCSPRHSYPPTSWSAGTSMTPRTAPSTPSSPPPPSASTNPPSPPAPRTRVAGVRTPAAAARARRGLPRPSARTRPGGTPGPRGCRDVVVLRRVPQNFGGNTLTATCAAVMIVAYRLQHPEAGLAGGTAIGGVLYLVARWRHWVLPSVERQRAETPVEASTASTEPTNLNMPTQLEES